MKKQLIILILMILGLSLTLVNADWRHTRSHKSVWTTGYTYTNVSSIAQRPAGLSASMAATTGTLTLSYSDKVTTNVVATYALTAATSVYLDYRELEGIRLQAGDYLIFASSDSPTITSILALEADMP